MLISNCCGAENTGNGDVDFAEFGICPDCKEHCEFEELGEDDASLDLPTENEQ